MRELLIMLENLSDDINKFFDKFSSRNITPQQIKNRIIIKRKLRKIKKALTPDEIIFPMILGAIILGAVGFLAIQLG
jgi:hypothetical protein